MKGLFKLLFKYIFASESIFMILLMPILMFGIMGEAMIFGLSAYSNANTSKLANSLIVGISATTIISTALSIIPITIVDFRNSVLMKRMGATNIKLYHFILIIIVLFIIQSTFSFFYSRAIATILFGGRLNWGIAFQHNIFLAFLYCLPIMVVAVSLSLFIVAISSSVRGTMVISRLLYIPISILSGGIVPASVVYSSTFLRSLSWFNPVKYVIEPYFQEQHAFASDYSLKEWQDISYPFIAIFIVAFLLIYSAKKIRWTS